MIETGKKLKEQRENSHLTISEVSLATKINSKVLAAMENGDRDQLPAKTFLRGFVRSYAAFLKMDVDDVLETFNKEMQESAKDQQETPMEEMVATTQVDVDGEGSGTLRMFVVGGILILIGLIIGVREVIKKYQAERVTDANPAISASPIQLPTANKETLNKDQDANKPTGEAAAKDEKKDEKSDGKPDEKTKEAVAAVVPDDSPAVEEEKPKEKPAEKPAVAEKAPAPAANNEKAEESPAPASVAKKARHNIVLEALDKVDVSFELKGETKKISLSPGQVYAIRSDEALSMELSDGGAVNIIYNGHDRGVPGDLGQPKKVKVP